jgi:hypothetical protein
VLCIFLNKIKLNWEVQLFQINLVILVLNMLIIKELIKVFRRLRLYLKHTPKDNNSSCSCSTLYSWPRAPSLWP